MGFFGNLDPEHYDRHYSDRQLLRRMVAYFRPFKRDISIIGGGLAVAGALDVIFPVTIANVINSLAANRSLSLLAGLVGLVLVTGLVSWGVNYQRRRLTARVLGNVVYALRRDAFRATVAHDLSFYDEFSSGRIVSRITSDTQEFAQVTAVVVDTFSQIMTVILLAIILFNIE